MSEIINCTLSLSSAILHWEVVFKQNNPAINYLLLFSRQTRIQAFVSSIELSVYEKKVNERRKKRMFVPGSMCQEYQFPVKSTSVINFNVQERN